MPNARVPGRWRPLACLKALAPTCRLPRPVGGCGGGWKGGVGFLFLLACFCCHKIRASPLQRAAVNDVGVLPWVACSLVFGGCGVGGLEDEGVAVNVDFPPNGPVQSTTVQSPRLAPSDKCLARKSFTLSYHACPDPPGWVSVCVCLRGLTGLPDRLPVDPLDSLFFVWFPLFAFYVVHFSPRGAASELCNAISTVWRRNFVY